MTGRAAIAIATATAALSAQQVVSAEAPPLRHNPFARPPSELVVAAPDLDDRLSLDQFSLTATMVSTGDRLANVGGRVLRPGDEVSGSKLLRVYEDRAVFLSNGKEVTVHVKPGLDDDNGRNRQNRRAR